MRRVGCVVVMASVSASSASHHLWYSSVVHGEMRTRVGLHLRVCNRTVSLSDAKKRQTCWIPQNPCRLRRGAVHVHSSTHTELAAEELRQPLGLRREGADLDSSELPALGPHRGDAHFGRNELPALRLDRGSSEVTISGLHRYDARVGNNELPVSAYVHLPFCKRRCFYCDFAIVAVGERNKMNSAHIDSTMESYIDSLCKEITSTLGRLPQVSPLKTLFFGGGTPSLLPAQYLSRIIGIFDRHCGFEGDAEISMEMDPGTFDRLSMKKFLECGVNRVSLGVQAFNGDFLKACGRSHGLQDVHEAIDIIHGLGVCNWSLDLISSLPHQTLELWEESLCRAIDACPSHVSVYDLQIEEGTKFGTWYKPGEHPLPDEDNSAAFYRMASSLLREAGYEHYEISNYAKPGFQCRHNLVYWRNQPYYGFGLGATSYIHGNRFSRPRKWKEYADFAELCVNCSDNSVTDPDFPSAHGDSIETVEDRLCDTIMLSLRLASGLDLCYISQAFGHDLRVRVCESFLPFINSGHAVALDAKLKTVSPKIFSKAFSECSTMQMDEGVAFIRLADPEGFLLSNEIISSVFSALSSK